MPTAQASVSVLLSSLHCSGDRGWRYPTPGHGLHIAVPRPEAFIGGHGGLAEKAQVEFKIAYLEKVKELMADNKDAAAFVEALKAAYPELPGDADALAQVLYKK